MKGPLCICVSSISRKLSTALSSQIGINGKTWRLIKDWYADGTCCVCVDGVSSHVFPIERGVRQGSVLSPTLFYIVMDPLLTSLESSDLGLCVNRLYGDAYLHADDIGTLSTSATTLQEQITEVHAFCKNNFLQLNVRLSPLPRRIMSHTLSVRSRTQPCHPGALPNASVSNGTMTFRPSHQSITTS